MLDLRPHVDRNAGSYTDGPPAEVASREEFLRRVRKLPNVVLLRAAALSALPSFRHRISLQGAKDRFFRCTAKCVVWCGR